MIGENKGQENFIKDSEKKSFSYGTNTPSQALVVNSNKANKLITALYMVTDIMDKDEPLRNKLRSLGNDILSDIYQFSYRTDSVIAAKNINKINEALSFLEISFTVAIISEMNFNILKSEFLKLQESFVQQYNMPISIAEFLKEADAAESYLPVNDFHKNNSDIKNVNLNIHPKGQTDTNNTIKSTRIGVQKGSTLMHALRTVEGISLDGRKEIKDKLSDNRNLNNNADKAPHVDFKKERREAIIKIIKSNLSLSGATITDIKLSATGSLASCGEKTLQRELIAMVADGVLKKTGEKRWSRYSLR